MQEIAGLRFAIARPWVFHSGMRPNSLQFYTYSLVLLLTCIRSSAVATDLQTDVVRDGALFAEQ